MVVDVRLQNETDLVKEGAVFSKRGEIGRTSTSEGELDR